MSDLMYFDCHVTVGQRPMKPRRQPWSTEHLLEDMDLAEIAGALVVHGVAQSYDVAYGNERLKVELAKAPDRLFAAWCIVPVGDPGFFLDADQMVRAMDDQDVRAVRLSPAGYSAHPEVVGPTLQALQYRRILTLMEAGSERHPSGWGRYDLFSFFHELLSRYPELPVLLTNHSWGDQRVVHRLMSLHDNLHIEFSEYQINRGLERYVADFGDERLLFGSGMTAKSPGAARTFVDYAQITDESKRMIAGANLRRLLRGQGPESPAPRARENDPIVTEARNGRPQSTTVLDAHSHALHEGGQAAGAVIMYDGDAKGLLEVGDWCGIDRMAMMSWNAPISTDARDGNEIIWRAMQRFGKRVAGVAVIDPTHMTDEEIQEEIRLRYLEQGFVGMKPYVTMNMSYEDDAFTPWWEFGNRHRLYGLMHVGDHTGSVLHTGGVEAVGRLADRFPEVSWLIAHSAVSWAFAEEVAACIRRHLNVYAEITFTAVTNRCIEFLVEATDEDHVIFGSDAPARDPRQQLGWVLWADLPVETRRKILGANFQQILDRVRLPGT